MKEPKVPRYSKHISQLCLLRKMAACAAKEAWASAMSFMKNHAANDATTIHGTHTKAAFCAQTSAGLPALLTMCCDSPPSTPNRPIEMMMGDRKSGVEGKREDLG